MGCVCYVLYVDSVALFDDDSRESKLKATQFMSEHVNMLAR